MRAAVKAFDAYTERRPVVVVVNIAFWWAGNNLGWEDSWASQLSTRAAWWGEVAVPRARDTRFYLVGPVVACEKVC